MNCNKVCTKPECLFLSKLLCNFGSSITIIKSVIDLGSFLQINNGIILVVIKVNLRVIRLILIVFTIVWTLSLNPLEGAHLNISLIKTEKNKK